MIYEYKCDGCSNLWVRECALAERNNPEKCSCGGVGRRLISSVPFRHNRTHPDVKQPMEELVAGIPGSNMTEL